MTIPGERVDDSVAELAKRLHADALVIDACAPILCDHQYARYWQAGGATCALATVALAEDTPVSMLATIGAFLRRARSHPDTCLALTADDIVQARATGRLAIVLMFQNSSSLGRNADLVEVYYRLGVRSMNLAYNQAEAAADGCMETRDGGLSTFGRRVVEEMNRVGMLLDLSHTGYRSSMEAMERSTAPVAFSHSNAARVFDHPRNLRDDQIDACVATGGVIGLNGHPVFVKAGTASPTIDDLLRHLFYLIERAGIDHVGLGLDFSQPPGEQMTWARYNWLQEEGVWLPGTLPPPPWSYPVADASQLPRLTEAMLRAGLDEADARKILGENFLRLFRRVWREVGC
ncbi:MAG: dipeptidase [Chloroflexi bacterium]|nr:dipeptidase [Chloroflexota bacterium]